MLEVKENPAHANVLDFPSKILTQAILSVRIIKGVIFASVTFPMIRNSHLSCDQEAQDVWDSYGLLVLIIIKKSFS